MITNHNAKNPLGDIAQGEASISHDVKSARHERTLSPPDRTVVGAGLMLVSESVLSLTEESTSQILTVTPNSMREVCVL
jgi:hypothetical protein